MSRRKGTDGNSMVRQTLSFLHQPLLTRVKIHAPLRLQLCRLPRWSMDMQVSSPPLAPQKPPAPQASLIARALLQPQAHNVTVSPSTNGLSDWNAEGTEGTAL